MVRNLNSFSFLSLKHKCELLLFIYELCIMPAITSYPSKTRRKHSEWMPPGERRTSYETKRFRDASNSHSFHIIHLISP